MPPASSLKRLGYPTTDPNPVRRYQSAEELAGDLSAFVTGRERRRRLARGVLSSCLVIALASLVWWLAETLDDRGPRPAVEGTAPVADAAALPVPAEPAPLPTESISLGDGIAMDLVQVPAGSFLMGSPDTDEMADADEFPQREVTLARPFWIGTTEVTVAQFAAFVEATGYETDAERMMAEVSPLARVLSGLAGRALTTWKAPGFPQEPAHPVVNVSWNDAVQFCQWLRSRQHRNFRLPTEAEWEYACRAGTSTRFHFGDDPQQLPGHARVAPLKEGEPPCLTQPVREFPPNSFELYGMHGNASEWCQDWYADHSDHYTTAPNPPGPETGEYKVRRGGAFNLAPEDCRSVDRNGNRPEGMHEFLGFRVVDGGPISLAGRWTIVEGSAFGWSDPVVLEEDGTSNLGFGYWKYLWNGCDRFSLTDSHGMTPTTFGGSDASFAWDADVTGNRLELTQQGQPRLTLERVP